MIKHKERNGKQHVLYERRKELKMDINFATYKTLMYNQTQKVKIVMLAYAECFFIKHFDKF